MPYYKKRKKSRNDLWVYVLFSLLMIVVGVPTALTLLSAGLFIIGVLLTKVFPGVTVFQATLIPLILFVFGGLYLVIGLAASDLKAVFSPTPSRLVDRSADNVNGPDSSEDWEYGRRRPPMGL